MSTCPFWTSYSGTSEYCVAPTELLVDVFNVVGATLTDYTASVGDTGAVITNGLSRITTDSSILGGSRDSAVSLLSGTTASIEEGIFGFMAYTDIMSPDPGRAQVKWDGGSTGSSSIAYTGLGSIDVHTKTNLDLSITFFLDCVVEISLYTSSGNWTKVSFTNTGWHDVTTIHIPLVRFTDTSGTYGDYTVVRTGTGTDLANVGAIVIDFNRAGTAYASLALGKVSFL